MAGKSKTQHILLDMSGPDAVSPITVKRTADVVLIDGLIFLYKKGSDLTALRIQKQSSWVRLESAATPEAQCARIFDLFSGGAESYDDYDPEASPAHVRRPEEGKWRDLGISFERIVAEAFAVRGVKRVVLGFDKRQYISRAKSIAQRKRQAQRAKERAAQIAKDTARGIEPTQGIPFSIETIAPDRDLPYPWSVVASDKALLGVVVQYILLYHIIPNITRLCKSPDQDLIIDGHALDAISPETLARLHVHLDAVAPDVPLHVQQNHPIVALPEYRNTIGECDHIIFHYMHLFIESPNTRDRFRTFRVMTNDTDLLLLAVCMLERSHGGRPIPIIDLQIPTRKNDRSTYYLIYANRVVEDVTAKHPVVPRPAQNIALAMYLKSHDYDDPHDYEFPFFNRVGHQKIVDAYTRYAADYIGPLVTWHAGSRLQVRGEAVKKVVYAAYFAHYDALASDKARLYPKNTPLHHVSLFDLKQRVQDKNVSKTAIMRMAVPSDDDIARKALRIHFLASLCDDAVNGRACLETRSVPEDRLAQYGYE